MANPLLSISNTPNPNKHTMTMAMAYSPSFTHITSFPSPPQPPATTTRGGWLPPSAAGGGLLFPIKAVKSPANNDMSKEQPAAAETETKTKPASKKPVYSMKKGQIVRVDKDKYLNSINYLSVGHPPYYKGLDYIYEDRGEVLDIRIFETGEYALIAWVGIPTAPAWLPTDMLIKSDRLNYERI